MTKIFLIAGEASGDVIGGRLMAALRAQKPGVEIRGIGGGEMMAQGLKPLFPMQELSVMGFAEIIPHIPRLLRRINETVAAIREWKPDVVVTIDSPGFNKRIAKKLGRGGAKLIHYVAPTVWAWRPGRAKTTARLFDRVLCLFPFEPPYFIRENMAADFVGHPVVESDLDKGDAAMFAGKGPLLCVLPGSRAGEIDRLMPVFMDSAAQLRARHPDLRVIIPTFPHLAEKVKCHADCFGVPAIIVTDQTKKKDVFAASTAALAASGTVSLELAKAGLPCVIAYRVSPLSAFIARRLVKLRYFTLTNILLDRAAVPEFFQEDANPIHLVQNLNTLLADKPARDKQIAAGREALSQLAPQNETPSQKAARIILDAVKA